MLIYAMRICRRKRNAAIYLRKEIHDFSVSVWKKLMDGISMETPKLCVASIWNVAFI